MTEDELDAWVLDAIRGEGIVDTSLIYRKIRDAHHEETRPYVGESRFSNLILYSITRLRNAHRVEVTRDESIPDVHMALRVRRLNLLETLARVSV